VPVVTVPRDKKHGTVINDKPEPRLNARALCALDEPPSAEAAVFCTAFSCTREGLEGTNCLG